MDIVYHPATIIKTQAKPATEPIRIFHLGEWRAFKDGCVSSLVGHTAAQRDEARGSWSKAHRWAFGAGVNLMDKLTSRADVQWALALRFGGLEE